VVLQPCIVLVLQPPSRGTRLTKGCSMNHSTVSPSPLGPYWEETDERGEIRVAHIDGGGVTVYSTRSAWYSRLAVLKKGGTWEEADDVYLDLSRRAREASAELRPTGALDEFGRPTVRRAPISAPIHHCTHACGIVADALALPPHDHSPPIDRSFTVPRGVTLQHARL
jgi:hypothetical protein